MTEGFSKGQRVLIDRRVKEFGGEQGEVVKITKRRVWVVLDSDAATMSNPIRRADVKAYFARCEAEGTATKMGPNAIGVPFYTVFEDWAIGVDPSMLTLVGHEIDLDQVAALLRQEHGLANAYVEQTGGGCATLYAGPTHDDPQDGPSWPRYAVVAGPGWFTGPGWTGARAQLEEFYYGPDDNGETMPSQFDFDGPEQISEATIARTLAEFVASQQEAAR